MMSHLVHRNDMRMTTMIYEVMKVIKHLYTHVTDISP